MRKYHARFHAVALVHASKGFQMKARSPILLVGICLIVIFATLSIGSLCLGFSDVSCGDIFLSLLGLSDNQTANLLVWEIRLPRLFAGILTGASLALAGAGMQSLFRNPLADPSITGVSSGSALGAVLAITFFSSIFALEIFALIFGVASAILVCLIGRIDSRVSALSTLLGGIAVNAFCGAIVGFFMYTVRDAGMRGFVFWSLGSLDRCGWSELAFSYAISIPAWIYIFMSARKMNVLLLGEENAYHCGVDVERVRIGVIGASAVMTASCVSICGVIGFVGLVVPHILRMIIGPDNTKLLPLSALGGAVLVIFADVVARAFSHTDPIPIGVVTALIGAPFFAMLLRRKGGGNA